MGCEVNRGAASDVVDGGLAAAVRAKASKRLLAIDRGDRDDGRSRRDSGADEVWGRVHHHLEWCASVSGEIVVKVLERGTAGPGIHPEGAAL